MEYDVSIPPRPRSRPPTVLESQRHPELSRTERCGASNQEFWFGLSMMRSNAVNQPPVVDVFAGRDALLVVVWRGFISVLLEPSADGDHHRFVPAALGRHALAASRPDRDRRP